MKTPRILTRRGFLTTSVAAAAGTVAGEPLLRGALLGAPAIIGSERQLPTLPSGVQVGDVTDARALVWSRSDRPARMWVDWATNDRFVDARTVRGPAALEHGDFTAALDLRDLPANEEIVYRVRFESLDLPGTWSEPALGRFRTAPSPGDTGGRRIRIAFTADLVGQGWGIDVDRGGIRTFETMRQAEPDVFIHSGDIIYADQPLEAEVRARRPDRLAQPRHRAEVEGGPDARGLPRLLRLQPPRREHAPLQRLRAVDRAVGRPRGPQQLVPRAAARSRRALPGEERVAPGGPCAAGVLRLRARAPQPRGRRAHLQELRLGIAGRDLRARPAQLPRPQHRQPRQRAWTAGGLHGPRAARLAPERAPLEPRHLEDHRLGPPDRPDRAGLTRATGARRTRRGPTPTTARPSAARWSWRSSSPS